MTGLLPELQQYNKPIVLVSNTPYEKFGVPAAFPTAVVCFVPSGRENLGVVADVVYRERKPTAKLSVRLNWLPSASGGGTGTSGVYSANALL